MKIHHIAIWTFHLEKLREFYTRYFNGTSNEKYINSQKGFESYFISFESGATLELMSRIDVQNVPIEENSGDRGAYQYPLTKSFNFGINVSF